MIIRKAASQEAAFFMHFIYVDFRIFIYNVFLIFGRSALRKS